MWVNTAIQDCRVCSTSPPVECIVEGRWLWSPQSLPKKKYATALYHTQIVTPKKYILPMSNK